MEHLTFDFSRFVAGVVYLTERPETGYVMSVFSNKDAALASFEVLNLGYRVREINLLTQSF